MISIICRFPLGALFATPSAIAALTVEDIHVALRRHAAGDWGDLDVEDTAANNSALKYGGRLLSAYTGQNDTRFWIITEADRQVTTVLLPDDY